MKIIPKGAEPTDLGKILPKDKQAAVGRADPDAKSQPTGASASVNISPEARQLQRIAELARKGDELRGAKVDALKERIASGDYRVDDVELAKDIARAEVTRILEKK